MGIRGSDTVALEFDGCRVPADALFGQENGGFKIAMMALDGGRIGISSQAIGIARAALEEAWPTRSSARRSACPSPSTRRIAVEAGRHAHADRGGAPADACARPG